MSSKTIQLPLLPRVKLKTSWYELLGEKQSDMPDDVRRARWNEWCELAKKKNPEMYRYWQNSDGCEDGGKRCKHQDGDWCLLSQLPTSINPYLTMKHGMIGMACMGAGFEAKD